MSQMAMLRLKKEAVGPADNLKHSWSCYSFNNYSDVPQTWIDNRNHVFEQGTVCLWNNVKQQTSFNPYSNFYHHAAAKEIKIELKQ